MKRKILITIIFWGAILLSLLIFCSYLSGGKWGKPNNGLRARIFSGYPIYLAGWEPRIFIKFRNSGQEPVRFAAKSLYASTTWRHNGLGFADAISHYPEGVEEITLQPKQASKAYLLEGGYTDKMGSYSVSGEIGNEQMSFELPKIKYLVFQTWFIVVLFTLIAVNFIILKFV